MKQTQIIEIQMIDEAKQATIISSENLSIGLKYLNMYAVYGALNRRLKTQDSSTVVSNKTMITATKKLFISSTRKRIKDV